MCVCTSLTYEHIHVRVCRVCMPPHEYARNKSKLGSIPPGLKASATNIDLAQAMITTQHLVHIQHKDEWKPAQPMEVSAEGKLATMRFEGGDTFTVKTEGEDTTTGYPTLREAMKRTFPTLVRD